MTLHGEVMFLTARCRAMDPAGERGPKEALPWAQRGNNPKQEQEKHLCSAVDEMRLGIGGRQEAFSTTPPRAPNHLHLGEGGGPAK